MSTTNGQLTTDRVDVEAQIRRAATEANWTAAATIALGAYGDEIIGYLVTMTRNETDAGDAFSLFAEQIWKELPQFRWESTFRTWAYTIARTSLSRLRRDPYRRRAVPLDDAGFEGLVAEVRSRTSSFLKTVNRDKIAKLRATLDPDDQTLLILRINRGLAWRDIAVVMADGEATDGVSVDRRASALRKRFERLKAELRVKAAKL